MTDTTTAPRRRRLMLAAALLATAGLTACSAANASGGGETTTIRYQGAMGSVVPEELGEALGYFPGLTFKKEGDVTGGPQSLQALVSNQIDVSSSAFFGAIAQLVATGAPIKAVVSLYGSDARTHEVIASLAGSGITKPTDLVGKKIAVNTLGANDEAVIDTWLQKSGLTADQVKQVTLVPLPPLNALQALQQHQVDAADLSVPQVLAAPKAGIKLTTLTTDTDVLGPYNGGGAAMTDKFLQDNPKTSAELVTGIAKAIDYIQTHSKQQVLSVYTAWLKKNGLQDYVTPVEENFVGDTGVADPHGLITDNDISRWISWLAGRGDVDPSKITPSDVYTNSYNAFAASHSGHSGAPIASSGASAPSQEASQ